MRLLEVQLETSAANEKTIKLELKAAKLELNTANKKVGDTNLENSDKQPARSNSASTYQCHTSQNKQGASTYIFSL